MQRLIVVRRLRCCEGPDENERKSFSNWQTPRQALLMCRDSRTKRSDVFGLMQIGLFQTLSSKMMSIPIGL